jgi:hypothetical protein
MGHDTYGWAWTYARWCALGLIAWCTIGAIGTTLIAATI